MRKQIRLFAAFLLTVLLAGCGTEKVQEPVGQAVEALSQEADIQETQLPETEQKEARAGDEDASLEEDEPLSLEEESEIVEDGAYSSKEEVAQYLFLYGHLPPNFITKKEAQELGWEGGSLEPFAPGKCIGGSRFGNYEGLLPEKEGRFYTECDIDTLGADMRGAKRIVFSNDGLIYYTEDHYESFELLYGEE